MRFHRILIAIGGLLVMLTVGAGTVAAVVPSTGTAVIQDGLVNPWDVAFFPDGKMVVTERPGRIRIYASSAIRAPLLSTTYMSAMHAEGEAGMMGVAVDRAFATNRRLYVCVSRDDPATGLWRNQVIAYTVSSTNRLSFANFVIRNGMVAAPIHNGCAVEHASDGKLWISMGDAGDGSRAQNPALLNGKILRANTDGTVPSDNPVFPGQPRRFVYSIGHRNPQGIAVQPAATFRVVAIEHGPDKDDEINRILPGRNYGWPCVTGPNIPYQFGDSCSGKTFIRPAWYSGSPTLATSNGAFVVGTNWKEWNGQLFVATLKEQDVRRFAGNGDATSFAQRQTLFNGRWGRLRAAVFGPYARLYLTTSNGSNDKVILVRAY